MFDQSISFSLRAGRKRQLVNLLYLTLVRGCQRHRPWFSRYQRYFHLEIDRSWISGKLVLMHVLSPTQDHAH